MIGGGFLGGGISIVPAGKAIIYASLTTEDGANIPNAVFKAVRTGSTVTANGGIDGRAELLVDAGHTYTVSVTPAGGTYLNNSQTVATASAKSYAVKFYLYPAKADEASTTASLNALETSISTHASNKANPHSVTKAQVGLGSYPASPTDLGISTATQTALDGKVPYLTGSNFGGGIELDRMLRLKYVGVGDVEFNYDGVGRHHMIRAYGDKLFVVPAMDGVLKSTAMSWHRGSDDIAYTWCNMRSSPGSSDAVNTKYVLDQVAGMVDYVDGEVGTHEARKDNPHAVTKAQVGLSNVDNTSDIAKPISTAQAQALGQKADASALTGHTGNTSNPHNVTKAQVGLSNVDNTSDANKPISTATQNALNGKQDKFSLYEHTVRIWNVVAARRLKVSLTVLNQSSTAFTLPTLREYLGSAYNDFKECTGVKKWMNYSSYLMGVRGGGPTELYFEGVDGSTGAIEGFLLDWMQDEVLLVDKVRQIV